MNQTSEQVVGVTLVMKRFRGKQPLNQSSFLLAKIFHRHTQMLNA